MTAMPRLRVAVLALLAGSLSAAGPADSQRQLTFEQRVAAQRAIERVYYSHQEGATRPFDEAVPREVVEEKVRTYLKQSVALEKFWRSPVTAEALMRELERIAANTQFPDRLREIYSALGNDSVLIQECLARPVLVERLATNFFAYDERIHGEARARAEQLRQRLVDGRLRLDPALAKGQVFNYVRASDSEHGPSEPEPGVVELDPLRFERWRSRLGKVGDVGRVEEERGAFTVSAVLAESATGVRVQQHTIRKPSWEQWWQEAGRTFPQQGASTVAVAGPLPPPTGHPGTKPATRVSQALSAAGQTCAPEDGWDEGLRYVVPGYRRQAVWTGSLVIFWGGEQDEDGYYTTNTGARYDPATDNWASMSTIGAPDAGLAIWAGKEMVVLARDQSARYNPVSDTWRPVSRIGAPQSTGTAVWTGKEVIVWGGRLCIGDSCGHVPTNTGARYDPVANTWAPISTAGAPVARSGHVAVWTGSEMIVWGGGSQSGGRYDPATDSWTAISVSGAPSSV